MKIVTYVLQHSRCWDLDVTANRPLLLPSSHHSLSVLFSFTSHNCCIMFYSTYPLTCVSDRPKMLNGSLVDWTKIFIICLTLAHFHPLSHRWQQSCHTMPWLSLARFAGWNFGFSVSPKDTSNCQLCDKCMTCSTSEPHQPQGSTTVSVCLVRFSIVMKLLALHISRTTHFP